MGVGVPAGVLGSRRFASSVGVAPTPDNSSPTGTRGTSTWSCCYRGWEPVGGLGPVLTAPVHSLFMEAPYHLGPTPGV